MKKLHLGSGGHLIHGWDNLDLLPKNGIIRCDLTKPLPYGNGSASFVFTEHFIEHLDEVDGYNLLRECYRVLAPGGRIRITCPDLKQYVEAYLHWDPNSLDGKSFTSGVNFLNYAILGEAKQGLKYQSPVKHSTDHGHRYYYDEKELSDKLTRLGFVEIVRCKHMQSDSPELRSLEKRAPTRDMVIEATKK
jgi:predicted SAM-dependent methyltransferase